jgi:hypothetical protein
VELDDFFPHIELQTNGITVLHDDYKHAWPTWKNMGLDTVAVSCASLDKVVNNDAMRIVDSRFSVRGAISRLAVLGFTVRVSVQLTNFLPYPNGKLFTNSLFIDTIRDAKKLGAEQITFRLLGTAANSKDTVATDWVKKHAPDQKTASHMMLKTMENMGANQWGKYDWGGRLYDFEGMSVCVADCLTEMPNDEIPRSYIFDGRRLRHSWQYEGFVIF